MCKFTRIPDIILGSHIKDPKMKMLCIELFALANFGEVQEHGRTLVPGQMITTLAALMERTGLSKKEVRSRIDKLVAEGKLAKVGTNHYLLLTIVGYEKLFKGTQNPSVTATVSANPSPTVVSNGMDVARNEAPASSYVSAQSSQKEPNTDTQKDTSEVSCIENNKENVVESDSHTTTISSLDGRRKKLVDDVNAIIESKGWKTTYGSMPEFNDAVKKFIQFYGREISGGRLKLDENTKYSLLEKLTFWLRRENALRGKINI